MLMPGPHRFAPPFRFRVLIGVLLLGLAACSSVEPINYQDVPDNRYRSMGRPLRGEALKKAEDSSLFGPGGLGLFGGKKSEQSGGPGAGMAVNAYLWRATLDTLSFMPLAQADPFGGTILTDWYSPPQSPNERFKVTAYILDRALRADGLRISAFREVRRGNSWQTTRVDPNMASKLEDAILERARQMRVADMSQ